MAAPDPIEADALYKYCDCEKLPFNTTDEIKDIEGVIGQDRAIDAIQFGIGIKQDGFNLFVLGPTGVGRHSLTKELLEKAVADGHAPSDWCYINNFKNPHRPLAIQLPPGKGNVLSDDMNQLINELRTAIPAAFETGEYHARVREIQDKYEERREQEFKRLADEATAHGITLIRTPSGFAFAPIKDDKILKPEEFEKLPEDEQHRIEEVVKVLEEKLGLIMSTQRKWQREAKEEINDLNREVSMFSVGHYIEDLKEKYKELPEIVTYLKNVEDDIVEHLDDFRNTEQQTTLFGMQISEPVSFRRYQINIIVDNSKLGTTPIIYEDNPLYQRLIGRTEHMAQMGALVTDFLLIKPGALHLANGGYLVLDALKILQQPYAWESLKRALFSKEINIQSLGQIFSLISTVSLEPEPIPLDIKIILVGDRVLYYLLQAYDPEFQELFKVSADFNDDMQRNGDNDQLYARLIATIARKHGLLPIDRDAVARVIEHSARLADDASKLSTHLHSIADLLREADYWAKLGNHQVINKDAIQSAIDMQIKRSDRIRDRIHEAILRDIILIDTDGEAVGQVNGLSVLDLGNFSFAQPSRITANVRIGEGNVVDIEREVELGGAIHSKGVMILSSFLGSRYANDTPLSLAASLVFEQSYEMVEGDSASVGELCALLSALASCPIRQALAITGSVNQHGMVQAIGGVNEKIEGYFDICKSRGLNGKQGVIIPESNTKHLMLRQDVVDAVRINKFSVYAVKSVDQAIELLTGIPAGERDKRGQYPQGTINYMVEKRLIEFAQTRQEFTKSAMKGE